MKHIFIINPYSGTIDYSERIRKMLKRKENFEYLVFDTEYKGHETALTERMCNLFSDEYIRFYVCGGSGTLANVIQGIQDFEKTEVALFPCGLSYDFLKCFGYDQVHFHNLNKLIDGEPMYVDLVDLGNHKALNTFSIGADAGIARDVDKFRLFSYINAGLTYRLAAIKSFLFWRGRNYEIEIDGKRYDGKYLIIYMGNGMCFGNSYCMSMDANPCDGELEFVMIQSLSKGGILKIAKAIEEGDFDKLREFSTVLRGREFRVKKQGKFKMGCTYDGEVFTQDEVQGRLYPGKLRMIVPKGVTIKTVKQVKEVFEIG